MGREEHNTSYDSCFGDPKADPTITQAQREVRLGVENHRCSSGGDLLGLLFQV